MKKKALKSVIFSIFTLFSLFLTAQDAPPSDGIFKLQNVATGEFLTAAGGSTQPVTMSATGEAQNTHWSFVESGAYYNIDSESETGGTGILRAPGAGGPGGPFVVVSTLKAPPAADTDKTWTIHYNATTDTYRFESRTAGRYLYHELNGTVTHTTAPDTDDRSNWKLIPLSQTPVGVPLNFQNVETGEFLTAAGGSSQPVTMSATGEAQNTHWTLVESGAYYNIDSESETGGTGILRAPGAGGPGGPYVVVSTLKAPPAADTDKTWTIHYNATTDTYKFESRTAGRYLYHEATGDVTHKPAEETDNRSNWKLIPIVQTPVGGAPDEDTGPYTTCNPEGQNATRTSSDLPNPVNVGTIDDRSCYADYKESSVYGKTWGVYNITSGSNHLDAPNTLQPRIERSLPRSKETGVGSYARFTGTLRILEVGNTTGTNNDGTYLMQTKGKHTGGGGPADPAICLYLAMPVYGDDGNGNQVQVSFDIVREQINYRGGSGAGGRQIVYLTNIPKDVETDIELEVGFREDPNNPDLKIHYSDAVIGGEAFNWNIPEPERGLESGIRYGAYRVKGGRAQMRWANTTYEKVEIVNSDPAPNNVVALRNVETGEFLTAAGGSTQPVTMSVSGGAENTRWTFVESGAYYNIDSESETGGTGILRAPGAGGPAGPYVIVSTLKAPPAADTDKTWTIHYNDLTDTYRFASRTTGRYLYQNEDGTVTHSTAPATDNRSVWQAIPLGEPLQLELVSTNVSCAGADDGTVSVSVTGGIAPYTYLWSSGETTATINNLATGTYSVIVTDALNETITASTEITAPSEIVVTVSDNMVLYTGYDGADQCATIGVTAVTGGAAPYQFNWSTGETTQMIDACPNSTQVYTATVIDADGCETTREITVDVIDVSCGTDGNPKVQICHNGKTICVAQAAVQAHLNHGDTLDECTENLANETVSVPTYPNPSTTLINEKVSVRSYPNPFTTLINADIEVKTRSTVKLVLFNISGNKVAEQTQQVNKGVGTINLPLNALPIGTYYLQVFVDNQVYSREVFIKI